MTSPVLLSPARRRGPRGAASFVLLTVAAVVSLAAGQTLGPRGLRPEAARLLLPTGWRSVIEDSLGEIGVAEVLRRSLGASADAVGWRGDRYVLCDHPGGASLLVAVIAWDTEDLAAGFVRAYARVMLTKHGLTPAPADVPRVVWSRGSSTFAIERHGRTVLLLEGVPTSALDALRTAVRARPVLY